MAKSMENFRDSPWIGNGFQVSKEMESQSLNILSAPVEKGFFLTMVLEEGGILGGIIFALFLATVYLKYMKLHFVCFLSTFTCMIIANCGEAIIFSSSHVGGICWILCMVALVLDVQREKAASMHQTLPAP